MAIEAEVIDRELTIPGLMNNEIEIFFDKKADLLKAIVNGQVIAFNSLGKDYLKRLANLMQEDEEAMRIMHQAGVSLQEDQLYIYYKCGFGALNLKGDVTPNGLNPEMWDCGCSGHCCLKTHFNKVRVVNGLLSDREVEVLQRLFEFKPGKAIAAEMGITEDTLNKHKSNIFSKTGLKTLQELMVWSFQNAII